MNYKSPHSNEPSLIACSVFAGFALVAFYVFLLFVFSL